MANNEFKNIFSVSTAGVHRFRTPGVLDNKILYTDARYTYLWAVSIDI
jgi:hypothetical protein